MPTARAMMHDTSIPIRTTAPTMLLAVSTGSAVATPAAISMNAFPTPCGRQQLETLCQLSTGMPVQTTSAPTQTYTKVKAGIPVLDSAKKVIDDSKLYLPNSRTINEVLFTADVVSSGMGLIVSTRTPFTIHADAGSDIDRAGVASDV